jgi:hypothetical protein
MGGRIEAHAKMTESLDKKRKKKKKNQHQNLLKRTEVIPLLPRTGEVIVRCLREGHE